MGALSPEGVTVHGLDLASSQGDRAVLNILAAMGARVSTENGSVTVRRGELKGVAIDAGPIPDLIPVLCVTAAGAEGGYPDLQRWTAPFEGIRPAPHHGSIADSSGRQCGGTAQRPFDPRHGPSAGGIADSCGDHRIAMSAAVAACLCESPVTVQGMACVSKSYPPFLGRF